MTCLLLTRPVIILAMAVGLLSGEVSPVHATPPAAPDDAVKQEHAGIQQANSDTAASDVWEKFAGEWRAQADAAQVVEKGVHQGTASMNFVARPIARNRLLKRFPAPTSLRLHRDGNVFVIEFRGSDAGAHRLPISGAEVIQDDARLSLRLEGDGDGDGAALRHIGTTDEGKRENVFRLGSTRDVLTMETTITSPRLPGPVRYTLTFNRAEAAAPL